MKIIGISEQKKTTIAELLDKNVYYGVPVFQREFSWKKDEWSDLYEDVERAIKNDSQHFFGFMMLKPEGDHNVSIIEGQQRLATVTIIVCVIIDLLFEMEYEGYVDFEKQYVKTINLFSPESPPSHKVSLSRVNSEFFRRHIQTIGRPKEKLEVMKQLKKLHPSNKLIMNCYKYFYEMLDSKIEGLRDIEKLKQLLKFLETTLTNFLVITTEVTDNKTAYNIFQTLNDRGLDLALADLLKVHLFELAGDDVSTAKDRWDEITNILGNINLNLFLRHFWVSKYEVVSQKYLMDEFEKKISTKRDVFEFLDELKLEAEFYEAIFNKSRDFWKPEIVELIEELFILSKNMVLPLLLAAMLNLNEKYYKAFLKTCIAFIFRYITIAERENKEIESRFSKMAIDMRNGKLRNMDDIKKRLQRIYVDDSTFKSIFLNKEIKTAKVAKYILRKIEVSLDPLKEKFSKKITLEHILPKNPNQEWLEYLKKNGLEKDDIVDKIGNMTLILGGPNKKAQNKFFTEKRDEIYGKMTELKINEKLASITSWTEKDILKRQAFFARKAERIWSL
ncbi:MAG: DUF262 domain-containing protein [Candidatus Marinimicrobia bacterium]|nr:DUF262 domain-containing protein [Candidatus Neomarinimicrobiota bacterium]